VPYWLTRTYDPNPASLKHPFLDDFARNAQVAQSYYIKVGTGTRYEAGFWDSCR